MADKPLVRSLDNLRAPWSQISICDKVVSWDELARKHKLRETSRVSVEGSDFEVDDISGDSAHSQQVEDSFVTHDDVQAFCGIEKSPSVEDYNRLIQAAEKNKVVRFCTALELFYSKEHSFAFPDTDLHAREVTQENDAVEMLHTSWFHPETFSPTDLSRCNWGKGWNVLHGLDLLSWITPFSPPDQRRAAEILASGASLITDEGDTLVQFLNIAHNAGAHGLKAIDRVHLKLAKQGELTNQFSFRRPHIYTQHHPTALLIMSHLEHGKSDQLARALEQSLREAGTPEAKQAIIYYLPLLPEDFPRRERIFSQLLLERDPTVVHAALTRLDYRFVAEDKKASARLAALQRSKHPLVAAAALGWHYRLDPVKHGSAMLKAVQAAETDVAQYATLLNLLPHQNDVASGDAAEGHAFIGKAISDRLRVIKGSRYDEALNRNELETVRLIRETLISKFGLPPMGLADPLPQLRRRMLINGTDFHQETSGNYLFCSSEGFLGPHDALLITIENDRAYLEQQGLSARDVAEPLRLIRDYYRATARNRFSFEYGGKSFQVRVGTNFLQSCPFIDTADNDSEIIEVKNSQGEHYIFVGVMPHIIETHGFFEGKGVKYRLEPEEIIHFFDIHPKD